MHPAPDAAKRRAPQWWITELHRSPGPPRTASLSTVEPLGQTWAGCYGDTGRYANHEERRLLRRTPAGPSRASPARGGAYVHARARAAGLHASSRSATRTRSSAGIRPAERRSVTSITGGCPQQAHSGLVRGLRVRPPRARRPWPTASSSIFDIYVPVKTTRPLGGPVSARRARRATPVVYAGIWMIDGYEQPLGRGPAGPVAVAAGNSTPRPDPYVNVPRPGRPSSIYYNPSQDLARRPRSSSTSATRSMGYLRGFLYTEGTTGTGRFEFGNSAGRLLRRLGDPVADPERQLAGLRRRADRWRAELQLPARQDLPFPPLLQAGRRHTRCAASIRSSTAPPEHRDPATLDGPALAEAGHCAASTPPPVPAMTGVVPMQALTAGPFKALRLDPRLFKKLNNGKHTVRVRSVDAQADSKTIRPQPRSSFKI